MKHPDPFKNPEELFHLGVKALIRNKEGKVLVLEANMKNYTGPIKHHYDLPGGRLHKEDTLEKGLKREVREEVGINRIKIGQLLDASISNHRVHFKDKSIGLILFTFECFINNTEKIKLTDNEHIDFKWVIPKEAAKLLKAKFAKSLVKKVSSL